MAIRHGVELAFVVLIKKYQKLIKQQIHGNRLSVINLKSGSIRAKFSYRGLKLDLVSVDFVQMISPFSDSLANEQDAVGFWIELRDDNDTAHYRKHMNSPIQFEVEVPTGDKKHPFIWHEVPDPKGIFVLLAPDLKYAQTLVVVSRRRNPSNPREHLENLYRFNLSDYRKVKK